MLISFLLPIPKKIGIPEEKRFPVLINRTIESVVSQSTPNWELIIVIDPGHEKKNLLKTLSYEAALLINSKHIRFYTKACLNAAQALNYALSSCRGNFIGALEIGNTLASHATYEVTKIAIERPDVQLIYPNHDHINRHGNRLKPFFKPSFSPDLLYCQNYFGDLVFYKSKLLRGIQGWDIAFDWATHYDLALRCVQKISDKKFSYTLSIRDKSPIYHTNQFLSHQANDKFYPASRHRKSETALLKNMENEEFKILQKNIGSHAIITKAKTRLYRPIWRLPTSKPLVSIIIPTHNEWMVLKKCIDSIIQKTSYQNYQILIIDNRSSDIHTINYLNQLPYTNNRISVLRYPYPFNYSAINNFAAKKARGSILCLLNNDTEVLTENWLELMVSHALRPRTACVGAMLYYPDGSIQHAGTIVGLQGGADHAFKGARNSKKYDYFNYLSSIRNPRAVTAAALVIQKKIFELLGGFDAKKLKVAFNDVDLCLKALDAGFFNAWLPHVEFIHHESKTRKKEPISHVEKVSREESELKTLNRRYKLNDYHHTKYD